MTALQEQYTLQLQKICLLKILKILSKTELFQNIPVYLKIKENRLLDLQIPVCFCMKSTSFLWCDFPQGLSIVKVYKPPVCGYRCLNLEIRDSLTAHHCGDRRNGLHFCPLGEICREAVLGAGGLLLHSSAMDGSTFASEPKGRSGSRQNHLCFAAADAG